MNSLETTYAKHSILRIILWIKDLKGRAARKSGASEFTVICDEYSSALNDAYAVLNQTELANIALKKENEYYAHKIEDYRNEVERLNKVLNRLKESI